jgi:hypothetical protein
MKLTKDNISLLEKTLINKYGVIYLDIRIEIIDHLANELEQLEGDFEEIFLNFIESKKEFIKKTNISLNRQSSRTGSKLLLKNIFSIKFILCFIVMTFCISYLVNIKGKVWFLENFYVLPLILPAPISLVILYKMFSSKSKSFTISFFGITNYVFMSYILLFIHLVRKADNFYWIPIFSFFITLSILYYYMYFIYIKQHQKSILN